MIEIVRHTQRDVKRLAGRRHHGALHGHRVRRRARYRLTITIPV